MSKQQPRSDASQTIVGQGVHIRGNLQAEADVWLDGIVDGSIHAKGNVSLGTNGRVKGNVVGNSVEIAGHIEGNVKAAISLHLAATGVINGDVDTSGLSAEDGSTLNGRIRMPEPSLPDPEVELDQPEKA